MSLWRVFAAKAGAGKRSCFAAKMMKLGAK
jgi:hypothetical protein